MHFPNAKWHVTDSQYSNEMLRRFVRMELKGKPVIAKREDEKRGKEDFYVDKLFRCHGNPEISEEKEGLWGCVACAAAIAEGSSWPSGSHGRGGAAVTRPEVEDDGAGKALEPTTSLRRVSPPVEEGCPPSFLRAAFSSASSTRLLTSTGFLTPLKAVPSVSKRTSPNPKILPTTSCSTTTFVTFSKGASSTLTAMNLYCFLTPVRDEVAVRPSPKEGEGDEQEAARHPRDRQQNQAGKREQQG